MTFFDVMVLFYERLKLKSYLGSTGCIKGPPKLKGNGVETGVETNLLIKYKGPKWLGFPLEFEAFYNLERFSLGKIPETEQK